MRLMLLLIRRELLLNLRRGGELLNPLLFFLLVLLLFPLGLGPEPERLATLAGTMIWIAALLAILLGAEHLFRSDYEDGSLEQAVLSPLPLALWVLAKVLGYWLSALLPVLLITPLVAFMFQLDGPTTLALCYSLLLGTPLLSLIAAIGSALTVSLRRSGMLLALLVLPLYGPVLIVASGLVELARQGLPYSSHSYALAGLCLLGFSLAPWAIAAALRLGVSQ